MSHRAVPTSVLAEPTGSRSSDLCHVVPGTEGERTPPGRPSLSCSAGQLVGRGAHPPGTATGAAAADSGAEEAWRMSRTAADARTTCSWNSPTSITPTPTMPAPEYRLPPPRPILRQAAALPPRHPPGSRPCLKT
jgi:hypothetical protein